MLMKSRQISILLACFFGVSLAVQAQTDSVRTEYKTEDEHIFRSEIQRVIRYITRANVEEKTLIKFGGLPNSTPFSQQGKSFSGGLATELAIERKVNAFLSLLFGFDNQASIAFYQRVSLPTGTTGPEWRTDRSFLFTSSAKIAARYYYNMAHRIKTGHSANNFSGAYVSIQARRPVIYHYNNRQYELLSRDVRHETQNYSLGSLNQPSFAVQWGIQQRLGKRGYVDLNVGPELKFYDQYSPYDIYNNLRYGTDLSRTQLSLRFSAVIGLGW